VECNGCHPLVVGVLGVKSRGNREIKVEEVAWGYDGGGSHKIQAEDSEVDKYYVRSCSDTLDQGPLLQQRRIVLAVKNPEYLTVLGLRIRERGRRRGFLLTYPVSTHGWWCGSVIRIRSA